MKAVKHESKSTTDPKVIRKWAEERGGQPATVESTQRDDEEVGILRIDFPGGAGSPPLMHITWEQFFEKFEEAGLAMVYQNETQDGSQSTFCKFVQRDSIKG